MDPIAAKAFVLDKLSRELPESRTYHSLEHTLDVYASAIDIGEKEGLDRDSFVLLKIAALYHDVGFTEQDGDHEHAGCRIARTSLPGFGFNEAAVEQVCAMIMATRIPQTPTDKLARILCDADLDYLGRNDFERIGHNLFVEMRHFGTLRNEREWNELQVRFLEKHQYFTSTNQRLREPLKQHHLEQLRRWLSEH